MAKFDPYQTWLGIARDQASDPRALLGLEPNENDPKRIHAAALERHQRVKKQLGSEYDAIARKILKEIVRARSLLIEAPFAEVKFENAPKPTAPAEDDPLAFLREPRIDLAEGSSLDFSSSSPPAPIRRSSLLGKWLLAVTPLFVLLNLALFGYWWFVIRKAPAEELRKARLEAHERAAQEPSAPSPARP